MEGILRKTMEDAIEKRSELFYKKAEAFEKFSKNPSKYSYPELMLREILPLEIEMLLLADRVNLCLGILKQF